MRLLKCPPPRIASARALLTLKNGDGLDMV